MCVGSSLQSPSISSIIFWCLFHAIFETEIGQPYQAMVPSPQFQGDPIHPWESITWEV